MKEDDFLYLQLANKLEQLIIKGVYAVGERLPSVRELHQEHGVSISTALQVYGHLEKKGWIAARERSGYYVQLTPQQRLKLPAPSSPGPAATLVKINDQVRRIREARHSRKTIPLDAPTPATELLPHAKLHKALLQTVRAHQASDLQYSDLRGYEPLRRHIARRCLTWKGTVTASDVIITNGSMEAMSFFLRAVAKPGDTIAIESPTFFGILMSIESLGMKVLEIATDPVTGINLEKLEDAFRKKRVAACLLISNYNNPLGSCMPSANKQALAALLHKYQVPLLEDDSFGELHHGAERPATVKTYDRDGWVLYCSSFSKSLSAGLRIGWAIPGSRFDYQVEQLKFTTTFHTSLLPQLAIYHYLEHQRLDLHLKQLRNALAIQTLQMARAIQQYFPEDTALTQPEGGFNLWIVLNKKIDTWELYQQALEHQIAVMPGSLFSSQQKYQNCLRVSSGIPWSEDLEWAVQTTGRLVKKMLK
jgi:DNA-binding transcriptional MocR family regulator